MALDLWIDEQLEKGYIEPSISPYASSFFFIKKKDGKLRPVQDYRTINSYTVCNQYPLPSVAGLREPGLARAEPYKPIFWACHMKPSPG